MRAQISLRVYVLVPVALSLLLMCAFYDRALGGVDMPLGVPLGLVLVPLIALGIGRVSVMLGPSGTMTRAALTSIGIIASIGFLELEVMALMGLVFVPVFIFFETMFGRAVFSMTVAESCRAACIRLLLLIAVVLLAIRLNVVGWMPAICVLLLVLAFYPRWTSVFAVKSDSSAK